LIYYYLTEEEKSKKYKVINSADNSEIYLTRPPLYLGGADNFNFELSRNIYYPQIATENGVMGTVNVIFTIDKNGKTSNYHVDKPMGYGLDEESIRVLKLLSDNWLPGLLNGQAVDIEYVQPVYYKLIDN
jgi:periplasmic protein TonB